MPRLGILSVYSKQTNPVQEREFGYENNQKTDPIYDWHPIETQIVCMPRY